MVTLKVVTGSTYNLPQRTKKKVIYFLQMINMIYPVGHKKLDDPIFANDLSPAKYTIYDSEDEDQLVFPDETNIEKKRCNIGHCSYESTSLLDYQNHYNVSHRYTCVECKKPLTSPHFLDIHVQETHDSFFYVAALKKPMYSCYIEECKEKFWKPEERLAHGIKEHNLPQNFRFDQKHLKQKCKTKNKSKESMELDTEGADQKEEKTQKFRFVNNKQKCFYTGKKFTDDRKKENVVNMDAIMTDLKDSLPST